MIITKQLYVTSGGSSRNFPIHAAFESPQIDVVPHRHNYCETVIVTRGNASHFFNNRRQKTSAGDVFILSGRDVHAYKNCTPDFSLINILSDSESLCTPLLDIAALSGAEDLCNRNFENKNGISFRIEGKDFTEICQLAMELCEECKLKMPGYRFIAMGLFMTIRGKIARLYSQYNTVSRMTYNNLAEVITCLNKNFRKDISIARLCAIAGMSKNTLMRYFFTATGTTPKQYQLHLKIAEASALLLKTDKTVSEVAYESGFSDSNYFARQFRRVTGKTPMQFRKCQSPD